MRCPRCGKNLMTEEEQKKWGFCTDCFQGDWIKQCYERDKENIDLEIQQCKNLIKIYEQYEKDYGGYQNTVCYYKKYLEFLRSLKED